MNLPSTWTAWRTRQKIGWFLGRPQRLEAMLGDESVRLRLREDPALLALLLADDALLKRLVSTGRALAAVVADDDLLTKIVTQDKARERILARPDVLRKLLESPQATDLLAGQRELLARLAADERVARHLLADEALLKRFLSANRLIADVAADDGLLTKIVTQDKAREKILARADVLRKLLESPQAVEFLAGQRELLARLAADERVARHLEADEALLKRVLTKGRVMAAMMADDGLMREFVSNRRVADLIVQRGDVLAGILQRPETVQFVAARPKLVQGLVESPDVRGRIVQNPDLVRALLGDERLQRAAATDATLAPGFRKALREAPGSPERMAENAGLAGASAPAKQLQQFWLRWSDLTRPGAAAGMERRMAQACARAQRENDVSEAFMDLFCDGDVARLARGPMRFPDRRSLWCLINEILINEEYYFVADSPAPRILDLGAHFGMAVYYFKALYPDARIQAFEPVPALNALARENVAANGWRDVEILPYALAGEAGARTFRLSAEDSMAGSLTRRLEAAGRPVTEIEVECRSLGAYLDAPVDYLKMDIEGSEAEVLEEAAGRLRQARHLFIEFHEGPGLAPGRFRKILQILEDAGFAWRSAKSWSEAQATVRRPMLFVDRPYSALIWARRRDQ